MASERKLKIIVDQDGDAGPGLLSLKGGLASLGGVAAGAATGGLLLAAGGVAALGAGLVSSVGAAMDAQMGQAELNAVLESTKGAAGMTAEAVNALASKYQDLTMFEDDAILSGQNMLLTFTSIGKDVFPMATKSMLNLAQKFGSMDQASTMLGKALNSPIEGISALSRVGIKLSAEQAGQIKGLLGTSDALKELDKESQKAKESLPKLNDQFEVAKLKLQEMTEKGTASASAMLAQNNKVAELEAKITSANGAIAAYTAGWEASNTGMSQAEKMAQAQKIILGEVETQVGGLAEAAGATLPGKLAILKNTFGDIQETIGAAFLPALMSVADQLAAGLKSDQAQAALAGITAFITGSVVPAIGDIMTFVGQATTMFMDWSSTLNETTGPAMLLIQDALNRINVATGGATGKFSLAKTALAILSAVLTATTTAIKVVALAAQGAALYFETWAKIIGVVKSLGSGLGSAYTGTLGSIKSAINSVIGKWNEFKNAVKNATNAIPSWLIPGSPTDFELGMRGIASAAGSVAGSLPQAFAGVSAGGPALATAGGSGGAPVNVYITYSPMFSTGDKFEFETRLIPLIKESLGK